MTPEEAATTPKMIHSRYPNAKVTYEMVQRAKANGISKNTLNARIHKMGWDPERAMTQPIKRGIQR
jgi:hypothetical protein